MLRLSCSSAAEAADRGITAVLQLRAKTRPAWSIPDTTGCSLSHVCRLWKPAEGSCSQSLKTSSFAIQPSCLFAFRYEEHQHKAYDRATRFCHEVGFCRKQHPKWLLRGEGCCRPTPQPWVAEECCHARLGTQRWPKGS